MFHRIKKVIIIIFMLAFAIIPLLDIIESSFSDSNIIDKFYHALKNPNIIDNFSVKKAEANTSFTPTVGSIIYGTNTFGSWRHTLMPDNVGAVPAATTRSWVIANTASGLDANLTVSNIDVTGTGTNKLIINNRWQIGGATGWTLTFQICDWADATNVDAAKDTVCNPTTGGWRTLNFAKQAISPAAISAMYWNQGHPSTTTAHGTPNKVGGTSSDSAPTAAVGSNANPPFEVYNGKFVDGSGNPLNTPLTNFVSTGTVKVRVISTNTTTTNNFSWDYLSVEPAADTTLSPGSVTLITGTAVASNYYTFAQAEEPTVQYHSVTTTTSGADIYYKFKSANTYTGANAVVVDYLGRHSAVGVTANNLYICNFNTAPAGCTTGSGWEILNNTAWDPSTTNTPQHFAKANVTVGNYISSSSEVWVRLLNGYTTAGATIDTDYIGVTIGSVNDNTGNSEISLGTLTASSASTNSQSLDTTKTLAGGDLYQVNRAQVPAAASNMYGYDCVTTAATPVLCAAATWGVATELSMPVTQPSNSIVTGIRYAARYSSNTATVTVVPGIRDYGGTASIGSLTAPTAVGLPQSGVVGGFIDVGMINLATTYTYSNGVLTNNPQNKIDTTNNRIQMRFRTAATATSVTGTSNFDFAFVSIKWVAFSTGGITIDGTVYTSAAGETTQDLSGYTIYASVNNVDGSTNQTTSSAVNGSYSISGVVATAGQSIAVYIYNNANNANTFTTTDGTTAITGLNLFVGKIAVGSNDGANATTNTDICNQTTYPGAGDTLISCPSGSNLTIASNSEFHILTGAGNKYDTNSGTLTTQGTGGLHVDNSATATLTSATVITGNVDIDASAILVAAGSNTVSVAGNWTNAGTFTANTGTVVFNGTAAAQTITSNAASFYLVTFNNSSGSSPNIYYTGALTIGNNTTLSNTTRIESTNNTAITFTGTINGGNILTINAGTSSSTFSGIIGGSTPIQTLAVTASTVINLNGGAITLAANYGATFTGPVSLGASTTINVSGTAHTVNFTSTINGANTLTISGGANTTATFGGVIGGVTPIQTLAVTATTAINLNTTAITLASGYNVTFTGPVSLGAGVTVTTSGANTVNFTSTINSADATDRALTLAAGTGGDISVSGAIGATFDLASLTVTGNDITLANIGGGSSGVTGATAITGTDPGADPATLTLTGTVYNTAGTQAHSATGTILNEALTFTTTDDTITFTGTVDSQGAETNAVTLAAGSAQVTFNNNVGASQSIGVLEKQGSGDVKFITYTLACTGLTLTLGTINNAATDSGAWTISGDVTISAGTLKATSNTLSVGGNWANSATFTAGSGTVNFTKGAATQTLNSGGVGAGNLFNTFTHSGAGTLQLITNAIDINGVFTNSNGTFDANDFNMNVADDFLISGGSFSADVGGATTQTVTFDGTNEATISGLNVFNNLTMNTTGIGAKTIKFPTGLGSKQTINGTWTLDGAVGQVLTLLSVSDATAWEFVIPADINPAGDYIDVKDSQNNTNAFRITAGTNTNDLTNNVPGWLFPSANTAPNNPDPATFIQAKTNDTVIATGGWTNEVDVKFSATASDPDNPDTLYLCVETKAIGSAFDGTESCDAIGVAYAGTPVTVTKTITGVTDTQYHWRVRIKDAGGLYSSWVAYGGNPAGDGTGDGSPANRDYGIDTSDPTGGTVVDGTDSSDDDYNSGSLTALSAYWTGTEPNSGLSGLNKYQYAIGTTVGGTDIRTWTDTGTGGTDSFINAAGLSSVEMYTSRTYYFSVRAIDNAGNTQDPVISSNGQKILPQLTFALSTNTITFDNLNNANNYNNSKTFTVNPISNAYNGFTVKAYKSQLLTSIQYPTKTIPDFEGGTYGTPGLWPAGLCTSLSNCGFGYSTSDDNVGGSNRFEPVGGFGTKFAPFSSTPSGETIADHETTVTGSTDQANDTFTISNNVAVDASQSATIYQTTLTFIVTANF